MASVNVASGGENGERKKGRSLSDMLNKQIEAGKEEALQMDARMDSSKRFHGDGTNRNRRRNHGPEYQGRNGGPRGYGRGYNYQGGGGRPPMNGDHLGRSNGPNGMVNSSLNWQQQSLMAQDNGYGNSHHQAYNGGGYGGNPDHSRGYNQPYNDGYSAPPNGAPYQNRNYRSQPNYHQSQGPNRYDNGGNYNGYNTRYADRQPRQAPRSQGHQAPPPRSNRELPEWADDLVDDTGGGGGMTSASSGLNWQQQALVNRDESDPFLSLVRGEHDLSGE